MGVLASAGDAKPFHLHDRGQCGAVEQILAGGRSHVSLQHLVVRVLEEGATVVVLLHELHLGFLLGEALAVLILEADLLVGECGAPLSFSLLGLALQALDSLSPQTIQLALLPQLVLLHLLLVAHRIQLGLLHAAAGARHRLRRHGRHHLAHLLLALVAASLQTLLLSLLGLLRLALLTFLRRLCQALRLGHKGGPNPQCRRRTAFLLRVRLRPRGVLRIRLPFAAARSVALRNVPSCSLSPRSIATGDKHLRCGIRCAPRHARLWALFSARRWRPRAELAVLCSALLCCSEQSSQLELVLCSFVVVFLILLLVAR
mmetsp:Transcript_32444/g.81301  ORF Transcript_32444/g.81301 Transcript_32444/m.81301 type:complete len:316 (+) Transcript_32444:232-1179(+)